MPSTFLRIAVDGDGDGRRDLIGSVPDALASTANYLHKSGWQPGLSWGFEVKLPAGYTGPSGRTKKQPMATWAGRGLTRIDGRPLGEGSAGLLLPAGPAGAGLSRHPQFRGDLRLQRGRELRAWRSRFCPTACAAGPACRPPWPTDDPGLSRVDRREVQSRLVQRGYDLQGKIDGVIGDRTREAIQDFQNKSGLKPDGRASVSVLTALRR